MADRTPDVLARHVAGFGLTASSAAPVTVAESAWPDALRVLTTQRLAGIAGSARDAGRLRVPDGVWEELRDAHRLDMMAALLLERALLRLAPGFEEAGIDVVVLKGPAVAHTLYPDPGWRPFGDLDLLVRSGDWYRTCRLLEGAGFRRRLPEPRPGFEARFGTAAEFRDGEGAEIDLHRALVLGPYGRWIDPEELLAHTDRFRLGGRDLRRLDDTGLLVHASVHAVLGSASSALLPLRDVAQAARAPGVDWDRLEDWSRRWRLRPVIRKAFLQAAGVLGAAVPEEARGIVDPPGRRRDRRVLAAYQRGRTTGSGMARSTMRAIPGLRAKWAYARALLAPSRSFMTARIEGNGSPSYMRRWLVRMRRGRWIR